MSAVFNWMEGGRAPDSVRMRWRGAESLPKSGMELPPAIPQSGNHCADRQVARQGGILCSATRNWEDASLCSVARLSCGETEFFARFNLPTTGSPAVLYFTDEIWQIIYNNAEALQSGGSCPSSPFTAAINRSRINTAGIGRRNSPMLHYQAPSDLNSGCHVPNKEQQPRLTYLALLCLPWTFRQLANPWAQNSAQQKYLFLHSAVH